MEPTLKETPDPKLIEPPVRFSESQIWKIQRHYFQTMGIRAWQTEVPFYISSNAYTGRLYAHCVVQFIRDWRKTHPQAKKETFYLLELGAGTGKFSFYFLKSFLEFLTLYQLEDQGFCYVISDVVESNLQFCERNESLQPYLEKGILDFTTFHLEKDKDFLLRKAKKHYSECRNHTPLLVIANYVLDFMTHDAFRLNKGIVEEIQVGLKSRYDHFNVEEAKYLDDLRFEFKAKQIEIKNYYSDPQMAAILEAYDKIFKEDKVELMMPLGAMRFLNCLSEITEGRFFWMVGDKGVSTVDQIRETPWEEGVSYQGCYSFLVNFHALSLYADQKNIGSLLTRYHKAFKVNLFYEGISSEALIETKACFENTFEKVGPDEFCYMLEEYQSNAYRFHLRSLISFLRLSAWDPTAYSVIHDRLLELGPLSFVFKEELTQDLKKVQDNVYALNVGEDVFSLLGAFFQREEHPEKALALYHKGLAVFGERATPYFQSASIYEKKRQTEKAIAYYQKAYALDKSKHVAKRKALHLQGRPYWSIVVPVLKGLFVTAILLGLLYLVV